MNCSFPNIGGTGGNRPTPSQQDLNIQDFSPKLPLCLSIGRWAGQVALCLSIGRWTGGGRPKTSVRSCPKTSDFG